MKKVRVEKKTSTRTRRAGSFLSAGHRGSSSPGPVLHEQLHLSALRPPCSGTAMSSRRSLVRDWGQAAQLYAHIVSIRMNGLTPEHSYVATALVIASRTFPMVLKLPIHAGTERFTDSHTVGPKEHLPKQGGAFSIEPLETSDCLFLPVWTKGVHAEPSGPDLDRPILEELMYSSAHPHCMSYPLCTVYTNCPGLSFGSLCFIRLNFLPHPKFPSVLHPPRQSGKGTVV